MERQPLPMVHCEVDEIIRILIPEVQKSGKEGLAAWNEARPNFSEELAILKIAYLARLTEAPIYIVHVSTPEGVDLISDYQRKGVRIIGETCLHYLTLTTDAPGVGAKINPPVRTAVDRDALWAGLRSGVLNCVGTDHGAKRLEHKGDSIWTATPGFPAMEVFFPLFLTQALNRGFSLTRIAEIISTQNARTFDIYPKKGTIAVGSDADLILTDMSQKNVIHAADLHTAGDFCIYENFEVIGKPKITMLRGQIIVKDGHLVCPSIGEYVPRFPTQG
jgi:dihydroorotase-like cyclic amidohydrolase